MKIKELKKYAIDELNKKNIEDSIVVVNILMQYCFNMSKNELIVNDEIEINIKNENIFLNYLRRIIENEPIEYITNKKSFMNCELYVNSNVLIPRSDTEILVENLIDILNNEFGNYKKNDEIKILELCTGSGCIPVGTLMYLKEKNKELFNRIKFISIDISHKALEVAKVNVDKYDLDEKIQLIQSDLFNNVPSNEFDIIVSNPPYIETNIINSLSKNVKKEPIIALDGGEDGLYFYNEITKNAKEFLKDNGYIIYEIGYNQAESVCNVLKENGFKNNIIKKDLSGNDRNIISRMK